MGHFKSEILIKKRKSKEMMKNLEKAAVVEEKEEEQSDLNRLPDEVLILIFNKVLDLKWLFWCSLVSKRFASLIPLVHAVSFTCPAPKFNSSLFRNPNPNNNRPTKLLKSLFKDVFAKPLKCFYNIVAPKRLSFTVDTDSICSALSFLIKFREVRYLRMEIDESASARGGGAGVQSGGDEWLYKWRVNFRKKLETFVFLSPKSLREMKPNDGEEGNAGSVLTRDELQQRANFAFCRLKEAFSFHGLLLNVIFYHRMLRSVVLTDRKKQGMVCVRDEELAALRDYLDSLTVMDFMSLTKTTAVPVRVKLWDVPVLRLPLSGYVMEGVIMVVVRLADPNENFDIGGGDDNGGGASIAGAFDEEGKEAYGEAVTQIMLNHMDKMKTIL